ncbi:hypothetical protein DES53_103193 [Roseimicrobium gellanilyticum]|uniref:Uncharacterized protein n=1 Tax=Roseimicrobium gellanilyticum TaxID=748857 RepID=A0A366HNX4_9BACT|nr:hypothetical protein DES53_103193 [Roseimicrobium gellanilyticum]
MEIDSENGITQSVVLHSNPKYLPEGRYTMQFDGITTNRVQTGNGIPYQVVRVHFAIQTAFHGRRKFYKQYRYDELTQLVRDLGNYFDRLFPTSSKSIRRRFAFLNRFKGRFADVRVKTLTHCPKNGMVSCVTEYHGFGYFRYQEHLAAHKDVDSGTLTN